MGIWITIGSLRKVSIEGVNNGVLLFLLCTSSCPLTYAWSTSIVNIVAPQFFKMEMKPSRATVYLTCSEPGLIPNSAFGFNPFLLLACAMEAALEISSYDELVHEPINPHSTLLANLLTAISLHF